MHFYCRYQLLPNGVFVVLHYHTSVKSIVLGTNAKQINYSRTEITRICKAGKMKATLVCAFEIFWNARSSFQRS